MSDLKRKKSAQKSDRPSKKFAVEASTSAGDSITFSVVQGDEECEPVVGEFFTVAASIAPHPLMVEREESMARWKGADHHSMRSGDCDTGKNPIQGVQEGSTSIWQCTEKKSIIGHRFFGTLVTFRSASVHRLHRSRRRISKYRRSTEALCWSLQS